MEIVRNLTNLALFTKGLPAWLALGLTLIAISALPKVEAQNLEVEALCGNRLSISWGAPPTAGGYQFTPRGDVVGKVKCSASEPNCVIEGIRPGQVNEYWLDRITSEGLVFGDPITLKGGNAGACPEYISTTPTPRAPVDTCANLPANFLVSGFNAFSTQCRSVGSAGVGNDELIAQGVLDAVDVWGDANAEIRVCFRKQGRLKFLDAATAPRAVSDLVAENVDGMTCGWINRAGTVALLQGVQTAMPTAPETSDIPPPPAQTVPTSTTICQLETTGFLSLRAGPNVYYSRLLSMPSGVRLVARARVGDWFMVNYEGQLGWASRQYLAVSPGCDGLGEAGAVILPPMRESPATDGEETMTDTQASMSQTVATESVRSVGQALAGCQVTTVAILNLRAGPGLYFDIIAEIPYQARLNAIGTATGWFEVEYEDQVGWVSRDFVFQFGTCDAASAAGRNVSLPAQPEQTATTAPGSVPLADCNLQTSDIINLRQGPGLGYGVLAEIPFQTSLSASARSDDWFEVEYEGRAGWVSIAYVFRSGDCGS